MSINIIEKDILENTDGIICHQVNCFKIGSGLAKDIITKYPSVREEHVKLIGNLTTLKKLDLLGKVQYIVNDDNIIIASMFGQFNYGYKNGVQYTRYGSLRSCLEDVHFYAETKGLDVHIPYMLGCGLGGGDWGIVYRIICDIFDDSKVKAFIYIKR